MGNTPFYKDMNTLVEEHLTDLDSEFTGCDRSEGSACHVLASDESSAEWGLYRLLDWSARQAFPETCDDEYLDRHGRPRNVLRLTGESRSAYLARILERMRYVPANGNKFDWPRWAKEVSHAHTTYTELVKDAFFYAHARGMGSINLAITSTRTTAQGGEEEPTPELIIAVNTYIDGVRPGGDGDYLVIGVSKKTQNIVIEVSGPCDLVKTETDITAYMKNLNCGNTLFVSQLERIALENGASDANVTTPAANVPVTTGPLIYQRIWPGTITVSAV